MRPIFERFAVARGERCKGFQGLAGAGRRLLHFEGLIALPVDASVASCRCSFICIRFSRRGASRQGELEVIFGRSRLLRLRRRCFPSHVPVACTSFGSGLPGFSRRSIEPTARPEAWRTLQCRLIDSPPCLLPT